MTASHLDRDYAARWDLTGASGHLDTAACLLTDAVGYLDGARRTRAEEILERITAALAELDRLREVL